MPIYEYEIDKNENGCPHCIDGFEVFQKIAHKAIEVCPKCKSKCHRICSGFAMKSGKSHLLTDNNIKKNGWAKYQNVGDGKYEKITGDGPSNINA
jgi:putative FmdB family regulatory protein